MDIKNTLLERSGSKCELCSANDGLNTYFVPPVEDENIETSVLLCSGCLEQINSNELDANHWRCLSDSMWSEFPAVQVMCWRMLNNLSEHGWAQDLLAQLYLDGPVLKWAQELESENDDVITKDSNGNVLSTGDSVTLIKDLDVKGANFTAKRGTLVKKISLTDDPTQIEGKVNGTQIVLLTKFLKKS